MFRGVSGLEGWSSVVIFLVGPYFFFLWDDNSFGGPPASFVRSLVWACEFVREWHFPFFFARS